MYGLQLLPRVNATKSNSLFKWNSNHAEIFTPAEQPELEITLFPVAVGTMFNEETVESVTQLI